MKKKSSTQRHISHYPSWYQQGLRHLWLPYAQMLTHQPPLLARSTQGTHIYLDDKTRLIDGIASWWSACHGYNPPHIVEALKRQAQLMPHIMFGGFVHEPALKLAERLCHYLDDPLNRVFFSESGSVSVEVALKMAIQYQINKGFKHRHKILYFYGGYHGDTFATMSICDPQEGMHHLFGQALFGHIIAPLPITPQKAAICRHIVEQHQDELAGIIVEPRVQGAGGMIFSAPEMLNFLRKLADQYEIALIFDEIFTGLWRTGTCFAYQSSDIVPDIITLSKALTGGTIPLAATIATERVFEGFLSLNEEHALMHGPTFMGNPLACVAAEASLDIFAHNPMEEILSNLSSALEEALEPCRHFKDVLDVRVMGAIGVVEMQPPIDCAKISQHCVERGAWIRPFRNIIYLTPAFTMDVEEINYLGKVIYKVIANGSY